MSRPIGCKNGVDQTYGDCVGGFMSMFEASSPPTLEDYEETQMLFRDFCILPAKVPASPFFPCTNCGPSQVAPPS